MKTKEEFESLVGSLTELELADLAEVMSERMERREFAHLRDIVSSDYRDEINEMDEKINRLERELDETEDDFNNYKLSVNKVIAEYAPLKTAIEDFENSVSRLTNI